MRTYAPSVLTRNTPCVGANSAIIAIIEPGCLPSASVAVRPVRFISSLCIERWAEKSLCVYSTTLTIKLGRRRLDCTFRPHDYLLMPRTPATPGLVCLPSSRPSALLPALCAQRDGPPALTGGASDYEVLPGDYLEKIGARYGVAADTLAKDNGIADPDVILPGKRLRVDHPHIVPEPLRDGIVINLPQRMLFFFRGGELAAAYPVGLGRPSWPTVQGTFHIVVLEKNLIWDCRNRSRKKWRARARSYAAKCRRDRTTRSASTG